MRTRPHLLKRSLLTGLTAVAMAAANTAALTTLTAAPVHAATCTGYVGLTFDDGPSNDHTPALLNALKQNGLRATLFNEGQYAAAYPAQVAAERAAGMWIGNHSYTHPHLTQESQSQIDSEIGRTQQAIAGAGGGTPTLFRPPYGETNATLKAVEAEYGLTEIIWDVDSQDWNGASVDQIVAANARLTNGQIILMHEWPANTLAAIPRIAQTLAGKGLCPGMISPQTGRAVAPDGGDGGGGGGGGGGGTGGGGGGTGGSSACRVTASVSSWSGGMTENLTIANTGGSAINGWSLAFTLPAGQTITSGWNATYSGSSGQITATNLSYNGSLAPGASTGIGFQANQTGNAAAPAAFTLNGTACSVG